MLLGETRTITCVFNTDIVADLTAINVTELKALLISGQSTLLKFRKDDATGYDGLITVDGSNHAKFSFVITDTLSLKLRNGPIFLEVWLKRLISAQVRNLSFRIQLMEVGLSNTTSGTLDEIAVTVEQEAIPVFIGEVTGGDVAAEAATRAAADEGLQNNIDAEANTRASADTTLQSNITAEAGTRAAADTTLQSNITAEAGTRAAADTTLQSNITAEAGTRAAADTTLQSYITAEAGTRAAADTTLQSNITTEANTRGDADTTLQSNITAEASARAAADTAINDKFQDANYIPKKIKVVLQPSDLLNIASTPFIISGIPAPGAGKILKVIDVLCHYEFVTEPYDTSIYICIRAKGASGPNAYFGQYSAVGVLGSSITRFVQMVPFVQSDGDTHFIKNEQLEISSDYDNFQGDGILTLYITYLILTI